MCINYELCTRISALKIQWVSRCKIQLQKCARNSAPRRGSRCFSLGRNFARESLSRRHRRPPPVLYPGRKAACLSSRQNIGANFLAPSIARPQSAQAIRGAVWQPVWSSRATSLEGDRSGAGVDGWDNPRHARGPREARIPNHRSYRTMYDFCFAKAETMLPFWLQLRYPRFGEATTIAAPISGRRGNFPTCKALKSHETRKESRLGWLGDIGLSPWTVFIRRNNRRRCA